MQHVPNLPDTDLPRLARMLQDAVSVRRRERDRVLAGKASTDDLTTAHYLTIKAGDMLMAGAALANELAHIPEEDRWLAYWLRAGDNRQKAIEARGGKAEVPPELAFDYVADDEADDDFARLGEMVGAVTSDALA